MRAACALIVAGVLSGPISFVHSQDAAPPTTQSSDEVAGLIAKLADPDFRVRRDASSQLHDMGTSALPKLREAAQDKNPEIRARASELVRVLEYQPLPGRPIHAGGLRQRRISYRITNGKRTVEVDDEGRNISISEDDDGIKMTVSGETNGQPATRTYTAQTPEQLRNQNAEAFALYQRYAHGGGEDFDGAMGNVILQGNGNVVFVPRFQPAPIPMPRGAGDDLDGLQDSIDREMDKAKLPPPKRAAVQSAIDRVEHARDQTLLTPPGEQEDEEITRYEKACDDLRKTLADNHLPDPGDALPPPKSARLGVQIQQDPLSGTLTVTHILSHSRAERIGLQDDDVIRRINAKDVEDVKDLRRLISENTKPLVLDITRKGKEMKLQESK